MINKVPKEIISHEGAGEWLAKKLATREGRIINIAPKSKQLMAFARMMLCSFNMADSFYVYLVYTNYKVRNI